MVSVDIDEKSESNVAVNGKTFEKLNETFEDEVPFVSSFEKLLEAVISDGLYQKRMIFGFMIPFSLTYAVAASNVVLLLTAPEHSCYIPGRSETNFTLEIWKNMTLPWEEGPKGEMEQSKCSMYNESYYDYGYGIQGNFTRDPNSITECQNGWYYDNSSWIETPVTKFDWVCNRKNYVTIIFTLGLIAAAIGTFTMSLLSDKFGRKPIFVFTASINLIFGLAIIFAPSFIYFGIFKFISGLSFSAMYQMPYIIVIEISSNRLRSITTTIIVIAFVVTSGYTVLMAHLLKEWKMFVLATQLPMAIFIFYIRFIPESPRWLLAQGRLTECEKVLTDIAETNGAKFTDEMRLLIVKAQDEEKKKVSATNILTSFVLTKHLILTGVLLSLYLIITISLNLNVHNMNGSLLINYLVLRVMELPGSILASFSSDYFGRRLTTVFWSVLSGIAILVASFLTTETWSMTLACGMIKMFIKFPFYAVYMEIGEMFPTSLRATAYGIVGVISLIGPMAAPAIIALGSVKAQLPYHIMFGICILASFIATFLPETLGQPLPQTMKEAKNVGKGQSYFTVITKWSDYKAVPKEENSVDITKNHVCEKL